MATQDDSGIPFSVVHDQQQFRLVELPPEILALIDSPNAPILSIKSQAPPTASTASSSKPAYAVLCTPTQTYQLRQVQTSNSVFATKCVLTSHGDSMPVPGVSAIATCPTTLELHPVTGTAIPYLKDALPLYDLVDDEMVDAAGNGKSKLKVFSDVPLSDAQCEWGWRELIAFEFAGSSFRPSAVTLLKLWKSINVAALAEGIDLNKQFLTEDLLKAIDDEGYPVDLFHALLLRLAADDHVGDATWTSMDRQITVPFVGRTLLASEPSNQDLHTAIFIESWKDNLPELWRDDAKLDTIKGLYILPTSTTISIKGGDDEGSGEGSKGAGSASRKWHERFARARRR
ncbi:sister chromatid cohesion protein-like protein Dcc1 [Lophium mytilinum]|uniref:Sister chromatid cohesion protein-like protein Dcc1 n=1 Tax=Lophium mytilinum TaxID=390894 RepID=A0A6A6QI04_9PEZI|nr:sister chromatid cohesion protein-like protein Dcc1 [Lophium mytilinum]